MAQTDSNMEGARREGNQKGGFFLYLSVDGYTFTAETCSQALCFPGRKQVRWEQEGVASNATFSVNSLSQVRNLGTWSCVSHDECFGRVWYL